MKLKNAYRIKKSQIHLGRSLLAVLMVTTAINPTAFATSSEQPQTNTNPYLQTLKDSEKVQNDLNYYFNNALLEKKKELELQGKTLNGERFLSTSYLLKTPMISPDSIVKSNCNLNSYKNHTQNPYPMATTYTNTTGTGNSREFTKNENNSYCLMQDTFAKLAVDDISMVTAPTNDEGIAFNRAKESLQKKDTLVVVIPGIFGEFIDQMAFGEMFGQGLSKRENPKESAFSKQFASYIKTVRQNSSRENLTDPSSSDSNQSANLEDSRFFIKKLNASHTELPENKVEAETSSIIDIKNWIKVSSFDDKDGKPLFKLAILGLEPMSLESLGTQEKLAVIYLRRLNKFMQIYKKMNKNRYPEQIVFVGYSRGTPISYEMLTILNKGNLTGSPNSKFLNEKKEIKEKSNPWSHKIVAALSLGGVSLGSSLADASVVFRDNAPEKTTLLQAFRKLIVNLKIITPNDVLLIKNGHQMYTSDTSKFVITGKDGVPVIILNPKDQIPNMMAPVISKLKTNIALYNDFIITINKIDLEKLTPEQKAGLEAFKSLIKLYGKIDEIRNNGVLETLTSPLAIFSIVNEVTKLMSDISKLETLLNKIITGIPELIPGFIKSTHSIAEGDFRVDTAAMKPFNDTILSNFGLMSLVDTVKNLNDIPSLENSLNTFTEFNNFIVRFQRFFHSAWDGGYELGTLPRLTWLANYGHNLPKNLTYYSVSAVLPGEETTNYQQGLGLGLNTSSDGKFLSKSQTDITKVGHTDDGLDQTFAGTNWNDSQVDWYKTVLWPSLYMDMTETARNTPGNQSEEILNSKVLGIVRTHHWGLALPYSTLNKTCKDPNTGTMVDSNCRDPKTQGVDNVNPFPRKEFLLSAVLSIHTDINSKPKQGAQ